MLKRSLIVLCVSAVAWMACNNINEGGNKQESRSGEPLPPDEQYVMQGKVLAQTAGNTLMGELTKMLSQGDVGKTIRYCNLRANPIVDSLSFLYKAQIKRTSTRVRNVKNKPSEEEEMALATYAKNIKSGQPATPFAKKGKDGKVHFYAPIFAQEFCLKCHGTPGKEIAERDYDIIKELYPNDHAVGYRAGDLRGMWSITFEN